MASRARALTITALAVAGLGGPLVWRLTRFERAEEWAIGGGGVALYVSWMAWESRVSVAELGKVDVVGARLAPTYGGEIVSADVVSGLVKGSQSYVLEYKLPSGGRTVVKTDAKQGRTCACTEVQPRPSHGI